MGKLISTNPATGEVLAELETTPIESLPKIFEQARSVQLAWGSRTPKQRAKQLLHLRETLLNHIDDLTEIISKENGKPLFEAMTNDLLPSVELLSFFAKKGPKRLRDKKIPMRLMKYRKSYLNYWPLGVVVIIAPWNFPFSIPFGEIVMALIAGNAVIFKPSEITPLVGLKIQELIDQAGLPPHIVQTVIGDGSLGAALIENKPNKIFFTGSVATGKKVMAAASQHLIPLNLELGSKDAMIVLPDADLNYATSAALWGGFSNSGQVCASIERILVHETIATPFISLLKEKLSHLRQGPSHNTENDLGAITFEKQKTVYTSQLEQAKQQGASFVTGGELSVDKRFLQPTIITGANIESLDIYNEETFGPVVAVTTFKSVAEAIKKVNQSKYGLVASIITRNISLAEEIAKQLQVGTVTINEVTYTHGLPETPWGGVKESGFGRTHSEIGLYEFTNARHIHKPRFSRCFFKSPWWFPYTIYQFATFRNFFELYRHHWLDKIRAFPHFLWHLVQFIKREKRI